MQDILKKQKILGSIVLRPDINLVFLEGDLGCRFLSGEIIGKYMHQIKDESILELNQELNDLRASISKEKRIENWELLKKEMKKFKIEIE